MQVVEFAGAGGLDVIRLAERDIPRPGPDEVLIRVAAAGVNRPDIIQRLGLYPPPPGASDIPGLEVSGHVAALGEGVTDWAEGEAVCALIAGGGYADYALAPVGTLLPIPDGLPLEQAAGLPETAFTVWSNVFDRGRFAPGEWLLAHGGSSGIGAMAIQLAKAFDGHVIATAGSQEKCNFCLNLGADEAVNWRKTDAM